MSSYATRFDTWHTLLTSEKCVESSCIDNEGIAPYNSHVISSATRHSNTRLCGNGVGPAISCEHDLTTFMHGFVISVS